MKTKKQDFKKMIAFIVGAIFILALIIGVYAFRDPVISFIDSNNYINSNSPFVEISDKIDVMDVDISYRVNNISIETANIREIIVNKISPSGDWIDKETVVFSGATPLENITLRNGTIGTTFWTVLDLSSDVGISKKFVILDFKSIGTSTNGNITYEVIPKGEDPVNQTYNDKNILNLLDGKSGYVIVETDSVGKIEWRGTTGFASIPYSTNITLIGYID